MIFISYKRNCDPDEKLAIHLQKCLEEAGYEVFRDKTGIHSGEKWQERIMVAVEKCECFVSIISNTSMKSNWVLNEIDGAMELKKRILPILVETLEAAIVFQEFRPRLGRLQHQEYKGDLEETARDIVHLLSLGAAGEERNTFYYADALLEDDSENGHWNKYFQEKGLGGDGQPARLTLEHCFQLAALRSNYFQRSRSPHEEAGAGDSEEYASAQANAFESFRQGVFCFVATGNFGLSGYSGSPLSFSDVELMSPKGYLQLLQQLMHLKAAEEELSHSRVLLEVERARYEAGMEVASSLSNAQLAFDELETAHLNAQFDYEDALDRFKVFTLGLPESAEVDIDDAELPQFAPVHPRVAKLLAVLDEYHRNTYDRPNMDLSGVDLGGFLSEFESYAQEVRDSCKLLSKASKLRLCNISSLRRSEGDDANPGIPEEIERELSEFHKTFNKLKTPRSGQPTSMVSDPDPLAQNDSSIFDPRLELESLSSSLDMISFLHLRVQIELLRPEPLSLDLDQAMNLAEQHRPDRKLLESDLTLKRVLHTTLRRLLRYLERENQQLDRTGNAAQTCIMNAHVATARVRFGMEDIRSRERALSQLQQKLQRYSNCLLNYRALMIRLHRELGTLDIQEDGQWQFREL